MNQVIAVSTRAASSDARDRIALLPSQQRNVLRTGVELFGSRYWHEDLAAYVGAGAVTVHFDPVAPSTVWLRRRDGSFLEISAIAKEGQTTVREI